MPADPDTANRINELEAENAKLRAQAAQYGSQNSQPHYDRQHILLLAEIVESSEDAIIGKTPKGIIQYWNKGAQEIYGYPPEEMIGESMLRLMPPGRADEETEILARIQRGERVEHFETVRRRKDGRLIDVSITISPIRNSAGVVGASHVARDITDRLASERNVAFLASIVESSDDAIIGKSPEGIVQSWNRGAERLYGYSSHEMIGRPVLLLLPPERAQEEAEVLARIGSGEPVEHFETVHVRKDGGIIHVSLTISPILNRQGKVIGASHVARNITERTELESATAHLAAIVEFSGDAIISKNLEGIVLTWNRGAEHIYGYSAEEMVSRNISLLLPPDRLEEERSILQRLALGERVEHFETVRVRKDGRQIHVSVSISPIRDRFGNVQGASHISRDISERKDLERKLRQTQKLESLGVLAGGVAHDFNNLLTGILGNASLIYDALSPASPHRKLLFDVIKAGERAADLTRQLLAYAGKGRFITERVDISALIREIVELIQTSVPRNVQLRLELAPGLPRVDGDASQLQQVIMNLVINGAEAIGEKPGNVIVSTAIHEVDEYYAQSVWGGAIMPGTYIALEVHDNGCGMDEATVNKIFDPFYTTKFMGRGLGLAAVMGIVTGHKGALKVYSTPGKGTTFKVLFPAVAEELPAEAVEILAPDLQGAGTILVVDDEEVVRGAASNALERYGYRVLIAKNGLEALEVFRRYAGKIDLVLLDLTMPLMGGEDTLRNLKEIQPSVKVLLSSGFNEVETIRKFTGRGLAGFIQKPYAGMRLVQKVTSILNG